MTAHAAFLARRRFGSLDGLRGLAVLAVVWHHSPAGRGFGGWPATWRGYLGVDLFFVLSGFLITTLLLRERDATGRIALGRFVARRTLRLFPLYYALLGGLALFFAFVRPDAAVAEPFFQDLPWYATYTSNWIHAGTFLVLTWSLAAEEQFYLTWAPLVRWLGDGARWVALAALAVGLAATFGLLDAWLAEVLGTRFRELDMVQATFDPIALGCLAAWLLHRPRAFARTSRLLGHRAAAPLAAMAVLAAASLPTSEPLAAPRPLVQALLTVLVLACVVREDHGLARLLRCAPLARVGVVSYGVYLLHVVTLQGMRPLVEAIGLAAGPALFVGNALVAWGAAELSYRWWETPFLRWKERLRGAP